MGLLSKGVFYAKVWQEDGRIPFNKYADGDTVEQIEVVAGIYGLSARVSTPEGDRYFPIHRDSKSGIAVGDILDPAGCTIVMLKRGDARTEKLLYNDPV